MKASDGNATRLLVLNPGSTSTKIAVYNGSSLENGASLHHSNAELSPYASIADQYPFRKETVLWYLSENRIDQSTLRATVGRGGLLRPLAGGTYRITDAMVKDLRDGVSGEHACNLGGIIAWEIAGPLGIPSFIVDPVVVDELDEPARFSGVREIRRKSIFHALNQKAAARKAASELGKAYVGCRLVVAHLGGGISVGAHLNGRVVDVNNALDGDGPFSPERSGGLPAGDLVSLCFSGAYDEKSVRRLITGGGGLVSYLGTNDGREVMRRIEAGDAEARAVFVAMAYQVAKEIGAMAAVLEGDLDAVVLTGGLANNELLTDEISRRVRFLGRVLVYPGEDEMSALAEGAFRVLDGEEEAKIYAP